ncbi:MAG: hypothetical protein G01um101419_399 [Parcubacteria group bacterium Gr01-1014_19]|nr:MAG: hypothetical protein G01um101419_399 [Parcubacteria group bacterium Gr01-1014_19]
MFKELLIRELSLQNLSADEQNKILQGLLENIVRKLRILVVENLGEKDKQEFDRLQDSKDTEKLEEFMKAKATKELSDQAVKSVIEEFKNLRR